MIKECLESMRPRVEEMLVRNGYSTESHCKSQHQRCGNFIDENYPSFSTANERVFWRRENMQLANDLALARTFRKVWEVSQIVYDFECETLPEKSPWACSFFQKSR